MSAMQPPDEIQHTSPQAEAGAEMAPAEAAPAASDARGRTWAHGMPALRVQRARWRLSGRPGLAGAADAMDGIADSPTHGFPPAIRLIRAGVGITLLALAWIGALAIYLLAVATFAPLTGQRLVTALPLRLVEGMGTCLMVLVVATLLVVGAFALSLALHPTDPEPPRAAQSSATGDGDEPTGGD